LIKKNRAFLKLSSKLVIIYIPLEWNDYSIGIVILMFGRDLFLGIVIPIGIHILLRRGIDIPLKNERNSYSNGGINYIFQKKHYYFLFSFNFFFQKKRKKTKPHPPLTVAGGRPATYGYGCGVGTLGVATP
jgi:hypothetical protein